LLCAGGVGVGQGVSGGGKELRAKSKERSAVRRGIFIELALQTYLRNERITILIVIRSFSLSQ
jgi:hypothetical protein